MPADDKAHSRCFVKIGTDGAVTPLRLRALALGRAAPTLADDYRLAWTAVLIRLPRVAHLPVDALAA